MTHIPPSSRLTPPASPQSASHENRAYASLPFISVTLEASGHKGAMRADIPLDALSPPVSRAALEGLSMRVGMPPNETGTQPVKLVQANGRTFLRVEIHGADVGLLEKSPIAVALGEARFLGQAQGAASAPRVMIQASTQRLEVDRTAPALRMELDDRANAAKRLEVMKQRLAELRSGSGSWFGTQQLEAENEILQRRVVEAAALLDTQRAVIEPRFSAFDARLKLTCMPEGLTTGRAAWAKTISDGRNAVVELVTVRASRAIAFDAGVAEAVAADDAKIAQLEAVVTAGLASEARVNELSATVRRDNPSAADEWLAQAASLLALPTAPEFRRAILEAGSARASLEINRADLERVVAHSRANLPAQLSQAEQAVSDAMNALAASEALIAARRDGSKKDVAAVATEYPADLKIL
jgi:hypothetical protein